MRKLIITSAVCVIALLCIVSGRLSAQKPAGEPAQVKQKIVYLLQNGMSHSMDGDPDIVNTATALPQCMEKGWRITRVDMTASAGVQPDQVIGIVVLEK